MGSRAGAPVGDILLLKLLLNNKRKYNEYSKFGTDFSLSNNSRYFLYLPLLLNNNSRF